MVKDTKIIDRIELLYPDLMAENAEEKIKQLYYSIEKERSELSSIRMDITKREQALKVKERAFNILSNMIKIEFKKMDVKEIKGTCALGIINPSDARYT